MFTSSTYMIIGLLLIQAIVVPRINQSNWWLAVLPVLIVLYGSNLAFNGKTGHQIWLTLGLYFIMALVFWFTGISARNKIMANQKKQ